MTAQQLISTTILSITLVPHMYLLGGKEKKEIGRKEVLRIFARESIKSKKYKSPSDECKIIKTSNFVITREATIKIPLLIRDEWAYDGISSLYNHPCAFMYIYPLRVTYLPSKLQKNYKTFEYNLKEYYSAFEQEEKKDRK